LHGQRQRVDLLQNFHRMGRHPRIGVVARFVVGQLGYEGLHRRLASQHLVPLLEQGDLALGRHVVIVFQEVGHSQQQVGQAHGLADHARQALDG
jgi:hypothetical protein